MPFNAQELVTLNVVFKPGSTYHFVEVEERTERGETRGMEDFSSDELPNPATWKTKTTINKIIHTGVFNGDSILPITIDQQRTREIRGKGIYKEGIYRDSMIVRGTFSDESLKFDSVQLLPQNDFKTRDAGKDEIQKTLFAYKYTADFFEFKNRKLRPGETFVNTLSSTSGKAESPMDSMVFTLLRVDKNIAVLSFTLHSTSTYKTSHIDKHSEIHSTGELKVDLQKQMIIHRSQEDRFFEIEKFTNPKWEIESTNSRIITETYVE